MSGQTSDVKREKINIFKIGSLWCFKYFFGDRELFMGLSEYYNRDKYRYTVKIDRFKKYAPILKNSIDSTEREKERVFIMKDLASVEEAIAKGAEKSSE